MQQDYSITYMSNPFFHLKGLGFTTGVWEELDTTPKHVTGGYKTVRYTKLEIEIPEWLEELTQEKPAGVSYPPPTKTATQQADQPEPSIRKGTTGLLNKLGKLLGK